MQLPRIIAIYSQRYVWSIIREWVSNRWVGTEALLGPGGDIRSELPRTQRSRIANFTS